jgi:hypothetical protein
MDSAGSEWLAGKGSRWQLEAKARWESFIWNVAEKLVQKYRTPSGLLDHVAELKALWQTLGETASFHSLFTAIPQVAPSIGVPLAEALFEERYEPLLDAFDAVAVSATANDPTTRLQLSNTAACADNERLGAAAVSCCTTWRQEGNLPEEAYRIVEDVAVKAKPLVAQQIARFVWWNHKNVSIRDWHLLASLPFGTDDSWLAAQIADRAADLVLQAGIRPDGDSVTRFLRRYSNLENPVGGFIERAFQKLAKAFPVEMFLMLWRRQQNRNAGNMSLKTLQFDFDRLSFTAILNDASVKTIVANLEKRLLAGESLDYDETRLLHSAIRHGTDVPSAWFEATALKAKNEEQLKALWSLASSSGFVCVPMEYPDFARVLLSQARAMGTDIHKRMFSRLSNSTGGRGSVNGEPDQSWKLLFESMEQLRQQYSDDAELGPLFAAMLTSERASMDWERKRGAWDDDE